MSDVRFLTAPGSVFTLIHKPGTTYPGITWSELLAMVRTPQAKEKAEADFFTRQPTAPTTAAPTTPSGSVASSACWPSISTAATRP